MVKGVSRLLSKKKVFLLLGMLLVMSVFMTGCFGVIVKRPISENEIGVIFENGAEIDRVVTAGRYSSMSLHAKMEVIDCSSRDLDWEDPDLWTSDKQSLQFKMTITYKRTNDPARVEELWSTYRNVFMSDGVLQSMVNSRIGESAKEVTVSHTLDGMLGVDVSDGGRNQLAQEFFDALYPELHEIGVELLNVTIKDISPSDSYRENLEAKADSRIKTELAQQETLRLEEQLKQEQAQTEIDLEIARRDNLVAEELAKVYELSPEAYEIARLEAIAKIFGDNDKIFFVQPGIDLTLLFTESNSGLTPLNMGE